MTAKGSGNYYEPHPLDLELLRRMPEEGTTLGFHTLGMTVAHATAELNKDLPREAKLTPDIVAARVRSMAVASMTVKVRILGSRGRHGWQRTPKGTAHYEEQTGQKLRTAPDLRAVEGGAR